MNPVRDRSPNLHLSSFRLGGGHVLSIGGLLPLLVALGSGCRILDRERYSLVIRKPAHRYRELTPAEVARASETSPKEHATEKGDVMELPPPETPGIDTVASSGPSLEPFRPFAYCRLHDSAHVAESFVAVLSAPVEFPILVAVDTGADVGIALARELERWWRLLFSSGSSEKEPRGDSDSPGAPK